MSIALIKLLTTSIIDFSSERWGWMGWLKSKMLTNRRVLLSVLTPRRIAFTPFATEAMAPILVLSSSPLFGSESMFLPAASKFCQKSCCFILICSEISSFSCESHVTRFRDVSADETFVSCFRFSAEGIRANVESVAAAAREGAFRVNTSSKNEQSFLSPAELTTETEPGGRGQLCPSRRPIGLPVTFRQSSSSSHLRSR